MAQYFDDRYEFRRDTDYIIDNLTGLDKLEYSLEAGREGGITDPDYLRRIDAFAEWYRQQPEVTHVQVFSDIMKRLNRNMHGDDPAFHRLPEDPDLAARYSRSFGTADVGLSVFDGTSRDPFLLTDVDRNGQPVLVPYYERIRQFGLDVQVTVESWLFKFEAIGRAGARDRLGREEEYVASVFGGEYTLSSVFGTAVDLSLIGEWNYDGRGRNATHIFQNDLFLAARFAFNDVRSTEMLNSMMNDIDTTTRVLNFEFNRRISDSWSVHLEAIALLDVKTRIYPTRPVATVSSK